MAMEQLPGGDVKLTQPQLLNSLLDEYAEAIEAHRTRGVVTPSRVLSAPLLDNDDEPMSQRDYLHLEGALIYLTKSRPDISTAVSFGAMYSSEPTVAAFEELIHCLKYLADTRDAGLIIKAGVPGRPLTLTCYVDASYLTHKGSKSHQGFTMSLGEVGAFYCKSSVQQTAATSSTHSEMRALYTLVGEIIFVLHLCEELNRPIQLPAIVMEDNSAVIALCDEPVGRVKRCKHFLMLVHWVREQVPGGLVEVLKVATESNYADILTKIVSGQPFLEKCRYLMGA